MGAMYERLSVGDRVPEYLTNDILIRMDYDSVTGWKLIIGFPEMRKDENDSFIKGSLMTTLAVIKDTPFFLFSFDAGPWMDTPFDPRINPTLPPFEEIEEEGVGCSLIIVSVDTKYGEILGFRQVGLSHTLSNKILRTMREFQLRPPISRERYRRNIDAAYSVYASSEEMLRTVHPNDVFAVVRA